VDKKYLIGLDARPLSTRVSGVGRLISETLIHFPDKKNYFFYLFSHLPIHDSHRKILDLPNIQFVQGEGFFSKYGALYYNIYLPYQLLTQFKLDLFWGSQQVIPPLFQKIPVVLTYCDLVLYKFPETMRFLARLQQLLVQSYSVSKADFILNISKQTRDDLVEKFKYPIEKTGIAYPGIDLKEIKNFLKQKPNSFVSGIDFPYLLSVSTLEPRKNYSFLLEVFLEYRKIKKKKNMKWIIVGKKGWERNEFFLKFETEKLMDDIIHLENIDDINLHYLYKKAEVFLFASKYEGFGIPLLEALSHQTKSLVSDIPTFHEIGGKSIEYLETDSPKVWAEKILKLEQSKKRPIIDLDFFSWDHSSKETHLVFEKILKGIKE
jgi:glycosyltransferase involved in cell wall biosynthesis